MSYGWAKDADTHAQQHLTEQPPCPLCGQPMHKEGEMAKAPWWVRWHYWLRKKFFGSPYPDEW